MHETIPRLKRRLLVERVRLAGRLSRTPLVGEGAAIVSLTSFGRRVHDAALAIESIGRGRVRPRRIVLWLDLGFEGKPLPAAIRRLVARGLEVRYVEDIRAHKKYFFALEECLSAGLPLVTIDDDFVYPPWFLERLLDAAGHHPDAVLFYRAREMRLDASGSFAPYRDWPFANSATPREHLFFTSGGGTHLPSGLMRTLDEAGDGFRETCPLADDIWLNYHALRSGADKRLVLDRSTDFTPIEVEASDTLWSLNAGGNDAQLRATFDRATVQRLAAA